MGRFFREYWLWLVMPLVLILIVVVAAILLGENVENPEFDYDIN